MCAHDGERANHVMDGDPFGDAEDDLDASLSRFGNCIASARSWNKDAARVGTGFAHRVDHGVKHWDALIKCALSAATWSHSGDDLGAVCRHLRGVESAFATGESLNNETCLRSNQDAHAAPPAASATAFSAASSRLDAVANPPAVRSSAASFAFVPTMRTTIGTVRSC